MDTKFCSRCKEEKDKSEFNKCKKEKSGLKSECRACSKLNRIVNRDKILGQERAVRIKNHSALLVSKRKHYRKYKLQILKKQLKAQKERLKTDTSYRLIRRLRNRVYYALKGFKKQTTTKQLLGCSLEDFKKYLESKFSVGMSWDNYGRWHVDHIKPCSSFNLSDPKELSICFHFTNTQPLWALDNIKKSNSY